MDLHVALLAEFTCTDDVYLKASELPFSSVLQELDDEGSFDNQNVVIGEVMDGTYEGGVRRLRSDWHEDDWFAADTETGCKHVAAVSVSKSAE